jgi:hypothetical protein
MFQAYTFVLNNSNNNNYKNIVKVQYLRLFTYTTSQMIGGVEVELRTF